MSLWAILGLALVGSIVAVVVFVVGMAWAQDYADQEWRKHRHDSVKKPTGGPVSWPSQQHMRKPAIGPQGSPR